MVYEKAKALLKERYMRWVIQDSLSPADMRKIYEVVGITYTGVRLTFVPAEALAGTLAEEFYSDLDVASQIIKRLNKKNKQQIDMIERMDNGDIESKLIEDASTYINNNSVGKMLWALVVDPRKEICDKIPDFISAVETKLQEVFGNTLDDEDEYDYGEEEESEEDISFADLGKEISRINKEKKKLEDKNKSLSKKIDDLKSNIVKHEETISSLKKQLHEMRKENEELKRRNEEAKIYEEKGQQLQQTIHKLERENRKINYELKKKEEQLATIDDLNQEKIELKTQVTNMKERVMELEEELKLANSTILKHKTSRRKL